MIRILSSCAPYACAFLGSLILTLILTPLVREMNRRLGMVDKPGARRINTVPVPRGGGLALVLGVLISYSVFLLVTGREPMPGVHWPASSFCKVAVLSLAIAALGYADDKFSLPPKLKLLGQLAIGALVWLWAGIGFQRLWPSLPSWVDAILTTFWIVGAVNAFNLIDGLDGLASGLALIATLGMGGSLFLLGSAQTAMFHFAFAGGLLGFLRYNYNPASVFLGDCGSHFIGFSLAVLPLATQMSNSFLVSVGVPLLAMGVPIFDTSLAILRRSLRHLIRRRNAAETGNGQVMTADADHLHHRILRAAKLNQRRAAWALYLMALFLVCVGLFSMALKSKSGGLWLFAVAAASIVIFKDISRIELFDAGRLLSAVAHDRDRASRRRIARLAVPLYLAVDLASLVAVFCLCAWAAHVEESPASFRFAAILRIVSVFVFLVVFRIYRTVWSRAMNCNYAWLLAACVFGAFLSSAVIYYLPGMGHDHILSMTLLYAMTSAVALIMVRMIRGLFRDIFYMIDCSRLKGRKDVSRVLVYGSGLRYRSFRRELVRSASANSRIIVGLLDDDLLLRGQYIGGVRVLGTLAQAPDIINEVNADAA